ncbi:zinc metalloproteinase nas-15-like isoform X1 [Branchiostoma floridae]|uniref:Metalloendopeptidase n=1 Tax=Branchiostoma floridae TaxID=7739 RepID=A0A9J7MV28_BRAFL|nr:zinc metalloproteinase nas-15-like isoform X1 [Branchiostoma floridae]
MRCSAALFLIGIFAVSLAAPVAEDPAPDEEPDRSEESESVEMEMLDPPEAPEPGDGEEYEGETDDDSEMYEPPPPPPEDEWEEDEEEESWDERWDAEGNLEEPVSSDDSEPPQEEDEEEPQPEGRSAVFPSAEEEGNSTEVDEEGSGDNLVPLPIGIELPPDPEFNSNYTIDETPPVDGNSTDEDGPSVLDSIIEINQNAGLFNGIPDGRSVCPEFECELSCMFGYETAEDGCPMCSCVPDGEEKLFEGDITLNADTKEYLRKVIDSDGRGASRRPLWTGRTVPYTFNRVVAYNSAKSNAINAAIRQFHSRTCIRFVRRTNQRDYIEFASLGGCFSNVGRNGGRQQVSIGNGCEQVGTVIHEILHALGFWHEQSRPDRDSYVRIQWANIPQSVRYNFQKYTSREVNSLGSAYDIGSVMHYGSYAFSFNRRPTITDTAGRPITTQRRGFSNSDLTQLAALYRCSNTGGGGTGTGGGGTGTGGGGTGTGNGNCVDRNNNCNSWSRQGYCASSRYRQYMQTNCRKACNLCSGTGTGGGGTGTGGGGTGTGGGNCRDSNNNCPSWSRLGYCRTGSYVQWMRTNCRRSCQLCSGGTGTGTRPNPTNNNCRDKSNHCGYWYRTGECTKNPTYMRDNCRKSCRLC